MLGRDERVQRIVLWRRLTIIDDWIAQYLRKDPLTTIVWEKKAERPTS
jgi:hypothetical protein